MKITAWNTPVHTGQSHLILIPAELLNKLELQTGDGLGGFTSSGLCCGVAVITELNKNHGLTIYGDDPFTPEKDGFAEGEPILLRQYQTEQDLEMNLLIEFDPSFPNQGNFAGNGISALKMGETAIGTIGNSGELAFNLFPNPTKEKVTLSWWQENMRSATIYIFNAFGQVAKEFQFGISSAGMQTVSLDVSKLERGTYFIKLHADQKYGTKKLILFR